MDFGVTNINQNEEPPWANIVNYFFLTNIRWLGCFLSGRAKTNNTNYVKENKLDSFGVTYMGERKFRIELSSMCIFFFRRPNLIYQ